MEADFDRYYSRDLGLEVTRRTPRWLWVRWRALPMESAYSRANAKPAPASSGLMPFNQFMARHNPTKEVKN